MNILKEITFDKSKELENIRKEYDFIKELDLSTPNPYSFEKVLSTNNKISIIAEIKKGSPSKGCFAPDLDIVKQGKLYESLGASCISVLTNKKHFYGDYQYIQRIRKETKLPILFKDFIIDTFQIKLAKYLGANVILLIKRMLSVEKFEELLNEAKLHNLEVLVEIHSLEEYESIKHLPFNICGINNRSLKDFSVDFKHTKLLSQLGHSSGRFVITESGIRNREDLLSMRPHIDGALIGETLIVHPNKLKTLHINKRRVEAKICGITELNTALFAEKIGADYIGLVFAKSKRQISKELGKHIATQLNKAYSVGVFLNQSTDDINDIYHHCHLDYVQIHGDINLDKLSVPKNKIILAYSYNDIEDCNYPLLLIDGKNPGSGESYSYNGFIKPPGTKLFLAGGLNIENVRKRVQNFNPDVVDISSHVETNNKKDHKKIKEFIELVGGL
jgi:indole-3-glycerol phosphate synthase/phosphoribosylanthranilate isomerase